MLPGIGLLNKITHRKQEVMKSFPTTIYELPMVGEGCVNKW